MIIVILWLYLVTVCHGQMITVGNSDDGCCELEYCECVPLSYAFSHINNNTVINLISSTVSLHTSVYIKNVMNITITSATATIIMCNDTGSVQCEVCGNVIIEGITWDQCGDILEPTSPGISFYHSFNIYILNSIFQQFKVCTAVDIFESSGSIYIVKSKFLFNTISDASKCNKIFYGSLLILPIQHAAILIKNSLFYYNGNSSQEGGSINGSLIISSVSEPINLLILVKSSSFVSNGIAAINIHDQLVNSVITFDKINVSSNRFGIYALVSGKLNVISSSFTYNSNGALHLQLNVKVNIKVYNTTFAHNNRNIYGTTLYVIASNDSIINISLCNFYNNFGGNSVVFINNNFPSDFPLIFSNVLVIASNFINNKNGPALQIAKCFLKFYSSTIFQNNSAKSGAAIYIAKSSQILVDDGSIVQFINNTASLRGGAMYIDLTNCYDHGIIFANFTKYDIISFVNNSAKLSGNSIYFNIPESCNVIREFNKIDSAAYIPYKFNYTQSREIIGSVIAASPYKIQVYSSANCGFTNSSECKIKNDAMLGQSVYFNTTLCDYFDGAAEATRFQVICTNCGSKYRLFDNELLVQNGSIDKINLISVSGDEDIENNTNIILYVSSLLSPQYRQLNATLSLTLSSCHNGFSFSKSSQRCECYTRDGYIQCEEDIANIRLGYWFGVFSGKHTFALCLINYCNFFTHRKETRYGFYNLPKETDQQCSPHRTGVACGKCGEGYTLAYNSPDCISMEKCSPGITVLVFILTALYWFGVIAVLFGVSHCFNTQQVSIAYLYGIVYFYSIVDILLVTNLHKSNGLFYVTTILSSFAKLNPQFLGRFCFLKDLDAIDQQFFHYCHVVFISIILIAIHIMAKCNNRALFYVKHCMIQVTCLVLLFAYSSITSASLLLLKAVKFDFNDGWYTYLSPHLRYYSHRHALYASVALLCGLLVTIGFPSLLATEPLMMKIFNDDMNKDAWKRVAVRIKNFMIKRTSLMRIKLLLDQLQDCYKDQYRWFAAYYLICRLVIMLISYFANNNYNNMIYYLQTACVVIVMTHIWIQPYKNDTLNVLDTAILLVMLLIVNLSTFSFSTSTTEGIAISLLIAPLLLLFGMGVKKLLVSKIKMFQANDNNPALALDSISTPR